MTRNPLLLNVTLSVYETGDLGAVSLNRGHYMPLLLLFSLLVMLLLYVIIVKGAIELL